MIRRQRSACKAAVAAGLLLLVAGEALAQLAPQEAVQVRPRPEFDPIGFEMDRLFLDAFNGFSSPAASDVERGALSSMIVLPKLETNLIYTNNLFRTTDNPRADEIVEFVPSVEIVSDWDNHSLRFFAEATLGRHNRTPTENYDDWKLEATGTIIVDDFDSVDLLASAERTHEQRGEVDDPGIGFGPTFVLIKKVSGSYQRMVPDGLLLRPYFGISNLDYENNGTLDNSDRDRTDYEYGFRLGYEVIEGTTLFVEPSYTSLVYDRRIDDNGLIRDTQIYEFIAGVTWDASAITFVEAGIGVISGHFDEPTFGSGTRPTATLRATWNATPLLTARSALYRSFNPTASAGFAGTLDTTFEASLDWEAWYHVILGVAYAYRFEEFVDETPKHTRGTNYIALNSRWLVNEYLFAGGQVSYETRSGDVPLDAFSERRVMVTLGAQL